MKLIIEANQFIPDFSKGSDELKEALVEFIFLKVSASTQPTFMKDVINLLNTKRENLKQDLSESL